MGSVRNLGTDVEIENVKVSGRAGENEGRRRLAKAYYVAKAALLREGYAPEIDWQYGVVFDSLTESTFLREAGWVILCCGISEAAVRTRFHLVSRAFLEWRSAEAIWRRESEVRQEALGAFRHERKIDAILSMVSFVGEQGFAYTRGQLETLGATFLERFAYLGPASSRHLAKNIGVSVAKPDRHLQRLAARFGYHSAQSLCEELASMTGDPVPVVDIVLWRYSARHGRRIARFT